MYQHNFKNSQELIDLGSGLDSYLQEEANNKLTDAIGQLAHNGIVKITGLDMGEISRAFYFKFLDLSTINELLSTKQSVSTLEYRCSQLHQLGLNVTQKRLSNYHYFIEAQRP